MSVFAGSPCLLSQNYIASLWLHRAGEKRRGEGPVRLRDCYDITGCPPKWLFSRQKDSGVPNFQTNPYYHCSMYLGLLMNSYLCQACITSTGMMPKMIRPFVVPNVIMCLIHFDPYLIWVAILSRICPFYSGPPIVLVSLWSTPSFAFHYIHLFPAGSTLAFLLGFTSHPILVVPHCWLSHQFWWWKPQRNTGSIPQRCIFFQGKCRGPAPLRPPHARQLGPPGSVGWGSASTGVRIKVGWWKNEEVEIIKTSIRGLPRRLV